jgi:hypothetical protein
MNARMEYTNKELGIVARWHGGAYIDIYSTTFEGGHAAPMVAVNVWNYATDRPTIPPTLQGLTDHMESWIAEHWSE